MFKKFLCYIICLSFTSISFSQKKDDPTTEDVTLAKKLKKQFPDDNLALELSEKKINFSLSKRDGKVIVKEQLNKSYINLDARSEIQEYSSYDGQSDISLFQIKSKNNKKLSYFVKDEAYTSDDLFHNDTRVKYVNLSFPLLGYKRKTEITKKYHDIKYFTSIYLNESYPTIKKIVKIEIPNWLELELKEFNFDGYSIKKNISKNTKSNTKIITYTIENVPAVYKEEKSPGPSYIYPHLLVLAKSYTLDGKKEVVFNSTQDQYNWYKTLTNSLENDNSSISDKVQSLIENAKTDDEKIKNIYYWVQDNIRYIAFEDGIAGFKPEEASDVYNKRYGDCKGMANLTKQMLIEAGFDARLTWIGTKRIAYDYSTPSLSVDNHMICCLIKDDETIFLDGTEKFNSLGEYANRIQGKQALIENGDEFILKKVPESDPDFNREKLHYNLKLLPNNTLSGDASKEFIGESRSNLLYLFSNLKTDKKDKFLEYYLSNNDKNISVSNINTSDLENRDVKLSISYNINIKNAATSFDDETYVDIDFNKELDNFMLDDRKTDYIFSFKRFLESKTVLEIPSNYNVKYLPENITIEDPNFDLSVNFSKSKNVITYEKSFKIKNAKIETTDFELWNNFISKLKNIYNEQIVLIKS